tara:strand:+ start:1685 stop:1888 length:204 start_codon:yes stop_codon:yes gene_type:complete
MKKEDKTKIAELNFEDNIIGLYRGKNSEYIITQEITKTGKKQKIAIRDSEMIALLKSLGAETEGFEI